MSLEQTVDDNINKFVKNPLVRGTGIGVYALGIALILENVVSRSIPWVSEHSGNIALQAASPYLSWVGWHLYQFGERCGHKILRALGKYTPEISTAVLISATVDSVARLAELL